MKNKAKTTLVSVIAMGFVLVLVMFMYYYSPTLQKTETLKASNNVLKARVAELETFFNQMDDNQKKIEEMTTGIKETLAVFPANVLEEDAIYLAISSTQLNNLRELYEEGIVPAEEQFLEDVDADYENDKIAYSALTISAPESLALIDAKMVEGAKIEGYEGALVFNSRQVTYNNTTDYFNLKGLLQSINYDPDKKSISSMAYVMQEDGSLAGNVTVNYYWVEGTDREYEPKDFGEYEFGLENLFVQSEEK